jgi:hypothetical protein
MRNHPGTAGRESFDFGWTRQFASLAIVAGRRPGATTTFGSVLAGAGMSRGRGCATLVGRVSEPAVCRHGREIRCGQKSPRRAPPALRTFLRKIAFSHRPHLGKRPTSGAKIIIKRHQIFSVHSDSRKRESGRKAAPAVSASGTFCSRRYLSGDMGMSMPPLMYVNGPSALGITSNAKMSIGNHNVAQALGISTTPEMWPCTGAVPRIA